MKTNSNFHKEFNLKFNFTRNVFFISNTFGVTSFFFENDQLKIQKCRFFCKKFNEIANFCRLRRVFLKHNVSQKKKKKKKCHSVNRYFLFIVLFFLRTFFKTAIFLIWAKRKRQLIHTFFSSSIYSYHFYNFCDKIPKELSDLKQNPIVFR